MVTVDVGVGVGVGLGVGGGVSGDPDDPPPQATRIAVANNSAMSKRNMFFIKSPR